MSADARLGSPTRSEGYASVRHGELFYCEVGQGRPVIVVHGGPDFDHGYLLPDMDRLAGSCRLIYYDQRGRGKSRRAIRREDLTVERYVEDLERLRKHLGLETFVVLGHSWGGRLAMEYAIRHSDRLSHMVLMNTNVATRKDHNRVQRERARRSRIHRNELDALRADARFREGDPEAVAKYYRIVFSTTIRRREDLERLNFGFTKEAVRTGREIEERLSDEISFSRTADLLPRLRRLNVPTLVLHGDRDFIPAEAVARIARAIPGARFVLLRDHGHFAYLESPDEVCRVIAHFLDAA